MKALLATLGKLLVEKKLTIAFAESATGGRLASEFSMIEDAGKFLKGGLVCYDAKLKETLLEVPHQMIETCTPESMEVTSAITTGLSRLIPADLYAGITGLPAPGGSESEEKPVGTMFIHCKYLGKPLFSNRVVFKGSPEEVITQTVAEFARLLHLELSRQFEKEDK